MPSNALYKSAYGKWAGSPKGRAPDYEACCVQVFPAGRGEMHHQCRKKRGYGPDEAYCKQHDPDSVKAREYVRHVEYVERYNRERPRMYAGTFLKALREIAAGHNDARGLATEVVSTFDKDAMKVREKP